MFDNMLETAIYVAVTAHAGQIDKQGEPYIRHPLRVMELGRTEEERIVGVLHDIIEDTNISSYNLDELGFEKRIVDAVVAITHLPNEPNIEYLARVKANPIALFVKLNDIKDNSRPDRTADLEPETYNRLKAKYQFSRGFLLEN
jgi:(p)ppGpp synthase/HD superfamily hydrolase